MGTCGGCGPSKIDAILGKLPSKLTPSIFNSLLMEAPKVYDQEIKVQPDTSPSIFTALMTSRPFPEDQTEYSEIRITRSAGIQFYNNREVFRKAYGNDCAPGCTWDPKSFDAGREIVSSTLEVADFEQEVPCYDNMLKSYEFVKFFLKVPEMLNGYMDHIASQYVRNELLARAKKIILTQERTRANVKDPSCFPGMLDTQDPAELILLGDLTPSVLTTLYDEITNTHPDIEGFQKSGNYTTFGLMIDPLQWRLKQLTDPLYKQFIINNPSLSSDFFKRFMVHDSFAEMFAILPTKDLPRADINALGEVIYHHRFMDVQTGSGGVKRIGNPGFANAKYGVALIVPSELGFLWDEQPIPKPKIGNAKFGPMFGTMDIGNGKWIYLPHYDYECNPLGKGGKWIAQYKTGFHPGPGIEGLYAVLYPLTKYENVRSQVPQAACFVEPTPCPDLFNETGCPCPMVKFCCNISSTQAIIKTDQDLGLIVDDTFVVVYDDGSQQTLTALQIVTEDGLFIYRASGTTPIRCNCIQSFICDGDTSVACYSKVLSSSDAKHIAGQWGMQLESCFAAPVATSLIVTYADGTTVTVPVLSIENVNRNGTLVPYHYVAIAYEEIVERGEPVQVKLAVGCDVADIIEECVPEEEE